MPDARPRIRLRGDDPRLATIPPALSSELLDRLAALLRAGDDERAGRDAP